MVTSISGNRDAELTAGQPRGVAVIAACCASFFLATTLAIASIALWMIELLENRSFHRLEVCFPIASFLLFIAGAHFLDKNDARNAKEYK